jgi:hypothetical protein
MDLELIEKSRVARRLPVANSQSGIYQRVLLGS